MRAGLRPARESWNPGSGAPPHLCPTWFTGPGSREPAWSPRRPRSAGGLALPGRQPIVTFVMRTCRRPRCASAKAGSCSRNPGRRRIEQRHAPCPSWAGSSRTPSPISCRPIAACRQHDARCGRCRSPRSAQRNRQSHLRAARAEIRIASKPRRMSSPVTAFLPVSRCALRMPRLTSTELIDGAIVEILAHLVLRGLALALVDHVFDDVLDQLEIRRRRC